MRDRLLAHIFNSTGLSLLTREHLEAENKRLEEENRELKRRLRSAAERMRRAQVEEDIPTTPLN